jgi:Flp pilus assembly protein TadD
MSLPFHPAVSCYSYYLSHVDKGDVSVLTRLANLLVRENRHTEAVTVYDTILTSDPTESGAWFNKAYAQVIIGVFSVCM